MRLYRHPIYCDQYEIQSNDDGTYLIKDSDGSILAQSVDDLRRLAQLLIVTMALEGPGIDTNVLGLLVINSYDWRNGDA